MDSDWNINPLKSHETKKNLISFSPSDFSL